jgi:hypothetical protein
MLRLTEHCGLVRLCLGGDPTYAFLLFIIIWISKKLEAKQLQN